MKYARRFKDEFIVIFDNDEFEHNGKKHEINGMTGINPKTNVIQIRDDIHIAEIPNGKPFTFYMVMQIWDSIQPSLLEIIQKKNFISRKKV